MAVRPDILIRPMRLEDLDQVSALDQLSFTLPWPKSAFRYELVDNPLSLLFVAEAAGPDGSSQVIAVIVTWLILDEAHIATIAVHPDYRGLDVGGELMAISLDEAARRGARTATLEVRAGNLPAQALYRRFQFQVVGRRPRYYRDNNEDALIMTLEPLDGAYREWLHSRAWMRRPDHMRGA